MDDATKNMMLTFGTGLAKKVLMLQAGALVSHGLMSSNYTEAFVSMGLAAVGAGWSLWNDYGKSILISQLDVLKARSLAAAAKIQQAGLKPVTTEEIAAQSPTLTAAQVTTIAATLPPEVHASVVPMKAAS
jgi:hypothetical protein